MLLACTPIFQSAIPPPPLLYIIQLCSGRMTPVMRPEVETGAADVWAHPPVLCLSVRLCAAVHLVPGVRNEDS